MEAQDQEQKLQYFQFYLYAEQKLTDSIWNENGNPNNDYKFAAKQINTLFHFMALHEESK